MHCAENVGHNQPASASAGVELLVGAVWGGSDSVECDSALNRSIDALDCNFDDNLLVIREIYKQVCVPIGRGTGGRPG